MYRKKILIGIALTIGIVAAGCGTTQPSNTAAPGAPANQAVNATGSNAQKVDAKAIEDVKNMVAKHDAALNDQNIEGVMSTFAKDPKVVLMGTGQGERFVGVDAIRNAYTEIFKDYEKGSFNAKCDWKEGEVDAAGNMAWTAAECAGTDSMKGNKREYVLNVSATLVKRDGEWRFIVLHMSNATASGPPPEGNAPPEKK